MGDRKTASEGEKGRFEPPPTEAPVRVESSRASPSSRFAVIIGAPPRAPVPNPVAMPWASVALLNFFVGSNAAGVGTGFLIAPDAVLTARHCLTDCNPPCSSVGAWFGFDGNRRPNPPFSGVRAFASHAQLDLAVLILTTPQAAPLVLAPGLPAVGGGVTLAGFGFPAADSLSQETAVSGPVTTVDSNSARLTYRISTQPGDSGAPLFAAAGGADVVVALHTDAAINPALGNSGVLLTAAVQADVAELLATARGQHP